MHLLYWFLFSFGVLSLLYFLLIVSYAGIGSSFSWFWLMIGGSSLLLCLGVRYMMRTDTNPGVFWRLLLVVMFLAGIGLFVWVESVLHFYAKKRAEQGMEYIVILGAQIKGTIISKSLKKRLDTALVYLRTNPDTKIIVSGGKGKDELISEAEAMSKYLVVEGIDKGRIQMEDKSTNTNENIRFSKKFIPENASVAIVTNGFHIYRSIKIAKKQGFPQVQGIAAPTDPILSVSYYVWETLGVLKDYLQGNL